VTRSAGRPGPQQPGMKTCAKNFPITWSFQRALGRDVPALSVSVALGVLLIFSGGSRLTSEVRLVRGLPSVSGSALVKAMMQRADRTSWVYTIGDMYPFHAGLKVIPELAVVPAKRVWSGLTAEQVLEIVKKYRPEQMILSARRLPLEEGVRQLAEAEYELVCEERERELYVAKWVLVKVVN